MENTYNTYNIILAIISVYFSCIGFVIHTPNFKSALLIKVIPFLSGIVVVYQPLKYFGII